MSKTKLAIFIRQQFFILFHFTILWFSWVLRFTSALYSIILALSFLPLLVLPLCCHAPWWTLDPRCRPVWLPVLTFSVFLFGRELSEAPLTQWLRSNIPQAVQLAVWHSSNSVWLFHSPFHPIQIFHIIGHLAKCFIIFFNRLCLFSTSVFYLLVPDITFGPPPTGSTNDLPIVLGFLVVIPSMELSLPPTTCLLVRLHFFLLCSWLSGHIGLLNYTLLSLESWEKQAILPSWPYHSPATY